MLARTIQLEVLNWEKYNPRNDVKKHSWFRFENTTIDGPDFFEFDHSELCFWIYCLSLASRKQSGEISITVSHAVTACKFQKEQISSAIEKLLKLQCVRVIDGYTYGSVSETQMLSCPTNEHHETGRDVRTNEQVPAPPARDADKKSEGSKLFDTYSEAFQNRYGVKPVRNARTNSMCSQIVKRLGQDAHDVARFYLAHNDGWYLKHQHDLGNLLKSAESLHTQWQRGTAVTGVQVRQFEKQSNNMDLLGQIERGEV